MLTVHSRLAFVESCLTNAFAGVVLGGGISIRQSEVIDRYGEGVTEAEFAAIPQGEITDDWSRVPASELERACVAHFDAEGLRYYIPALAISVVRQYDGASMRVIGTLSSLYPDKQAWHYHMERYSLLTGPQKVALATYLWHLPHLVPLEHEEPKQVERALRDYWGPFLAEPYGA